MIERMKSHFAMMAEYNAWANARLYHMARMLPDDQYRRDVGVYFKSLHGTLNHILVADLIWMHRLAGAGRLPARLDETIHEDFSALSAERQQQDERIQNFGSGLTDAQLEESWEFRTLNGALR